MGIYVNPKNTAFRQARNSKIYVDKSGLISYTNQVLDTLQKNLCVSRPRRFGKSMAADMLAAYYSRGCQSGHLFDGLEVEKDESFNSHLNRHNVIRLDIQQFLFNETHLDIFIGKLQEVVINELRLEFGNCFHVDQYGLPGVLRQIYAGTEQGFIFIIDEWDCVFRVAKERRDIQKEYLDFLRGLFKGADYVELAYMTGILPIKKYGEHSAVNIFDEYSMVDSKNLGAYFGFTEEEVRTLCKKHNMNYSEMQSWYDGYSLGNLHIYNPKSVADALLWREFQSYWTGTETYEALKIYIDMNFDGLKEAVIEMLAGRGCKINTRHFQNDMTTFNTRDDVMTLLVHLGYLTYDQKLSRAFIPNQEIAQEFLNAADGSGWDGVIQSLNRSQELLESTWDLDGDSVAAGLAAIHSQTSSILKYNDENSLACAILMAYYSAKAYYMNPVMELPSGKGFADVVCLPRRNTDKPALLVELKWNKSAKGAIEQIKERQYADWVKEYTGDILLVGINYDQEKGHQCVIETFVKE